MGPFGPALALACRIVLAAVLAVAAAGKVVGRDELPARLRAMGIAARWSRAVAVGLPVAELAVAIALVAVPRSEVPALAAIVLLLAFTGFLLRAARHAVPCACFGAVRNDTATTVAGAIVRNGLLVALAVVATGTIAGARPLGTTVVALVAATVAGAAIARVA